MATRMLIIQAGQQGTYTGSFATNEYIEPRELDDGRFALPERLLYNDACVSAFPGLVNLPVEDLDL